MNSRILTIRVLQQFGSAAVGLATGILTARWLGPEGKGLLAIVMLVGTVASQIGTMGLHDAAPYLTKRQGIAAAHLRRAFDLFVLGWGVPLGALTALGMYVYGPLFWSYPVAIALAAVTGLLIAFRLSVLLSKGLLLAEGQFARVAVLDFCDAALPGVIFLAAAWFWAPSATIASASFMAGALTIAIAARISTATFASAPLSQRSQLLPRMMRYGSRTNLRQIGTMAISRVDQFLVSMLAGVAGVGLYSVAITLAELIVRIPDAISWMLMPSAAAVGDTQAHVMSARWTRLSILVTAVIALPYLLCANWAIALVLPAFRVSGRLLAWLLPGAVMSSAVRILGADLVGRGRAGTVARITWATVVVGLALDLVLIPKMGLRGAACASTLAQVFAATAIARTYRAESGLSIRSLFVVHAADFSGLRALRVRQFVPAILRAGAGR